MEDVAGCVVLHSHNKVPSSKFNMTRNAQWFSLAWMVKCLPTMWETRVRSLGREDPLEKEMATHASIPAWKIPWMEEPGGLQSMRRQRVRHD